MTHFLPTLLSETSQWVVVSKPAGWLTIPPISPQKKLTAGLPETKGSFSTSDESSRKIYHFHPILSDWLKKEFGPLWVVHRLDRETSGAILFARSAKDHAQACDWFQNRKTKKIYSCLAVGVPHSPILKLNEPIRGVPSLTQVEVITSYKEGFIGKILLRTGRRHQIRIHLSQQDHALWGDVTYGGPSEIVFKEKSRSLKVPRVALHSSSLELPTGERFEAPLPEDFSSWLEHLCKEGTLV